MADLDILSVFRDSGALLEGHFGLTSGKHSSTYLQCAQVLQYPDRARALAAALAGSISENCGSERVDLVVSPAVGGIVIGQEVAASLGCRSIFCERVDGEMAFRRGFTVGEGSRIVVVEDVVTTGGSLKEAARLSEAEGAAIAATASIVHRFTGEKPEAPTAYPHVSLLQIHAPAYDPTDCPMCKDGLSVEKPGSRHLSAAKGV
jgi:orotate phosphoribosyltransferase